MLTVDEALTALTQAGRTVQIHLDPEDGYWYVDAMPEQGGTPTESYYSHVSALSALEGLWREVQENEKARGMRRCSYCGNMERISTTCTTFPLAFASEHGLPI